jgi:hypothetical protein
MTIDVFLSRRNGLLVGFTGQGLSKFNVPVTIEDVGSVSRLVA